MFARTRGHSPGLDRAVAAYSRAGEHAACWLALGLAGAAGRPAIADRRRCWLRGVGVVAGVLRGEPGDQVRGPPAPARPGRLAAPDPGGHAPLVPERPRHDLVRRRAGVPTASRRHGRCTSPPARSRSAARTSGCTTRATWSPARCSGRAVGRACGRVRAAAGVGRRPWHRVSGRNAAAWVGRAVPLPAPPELRAPFSAPSSLWSRRTPIGSRKAPASRETASVTCRSAPTEEMYRDRNGDFSTHRPARPTFAGSRQRLLSA